MRRALTFATAGLLLLGVQVFAAPPDLGQGWSDGERQGFYGTSQGSQLLPYAWFMALERADSATPFAMNLDRFGYIANPDFVRVMAVQRVSEDGIRRLAPTVVPLARAEGLRAHAESVEARVK